MQERKIKTVIRCQEMSIGVASVQRKEFTTASAVYYREQRFAAKNAVVVVAVIVGQASWPNIWH